MEKRREHIWFSGQVQGVGFRFRAKHLANMLGLTGWVKNDWDGRMEMQVQGTLPAIERLLVLLDELHFVEITSVEREKISTESELDFQIR